jgi:hypothetical protein
MNMCIVITVAILILLRDSGPSGIIFMTLSIRDLLYVHVLL